MRSLTARSFDRRRKNDRGARRSYTLLELLLVVGILVIVASAVAPAVLQRMNDYHLKETTESVRSALAATRLHAIDLSSTYQFRFSPGGRRYLAVPTDSEVLNQILQGGGTNGAAGAPNGLLKTAIESGQLGESFTFQVAAALTPTAPIDPMAAAAADQAFTSVASQVQTTTPDMAPVAWSSPIVFRPDGSACDAAVNVVDSHGSGFRIVIRELTGEIVVQRLEQQGTL
jgi:Tfp pilus assembly protein FimT